MELLFESNLPSSDYLKLHRQKVEVKNADSKKRLMTKRRKTKRRRGQNVGWKTPNGTKHRMEKRRMGQNVE
jgi:hypothetical protein